MFVILQKYDFSSKSQQRFFLLRTLVRCLWYCKSTTFQANHNTSHLNRRLSVDVCDTAKVRLFKQITTRGRAPTGWARCLWYCKSTTFQANHNENKELFTRIEMFVILQKYDFSSKSQHVILMLIHLLGCLWYCKSTTFQANHNKWSVPCVAALMFVILQKYDFSSKSQRFLCS